MMMLSILRTTVAAGLMLGISGLSAFADTLDDPLHGCVAGTACTESTIGGNAVTPIASVGAPGFGFFASPAQSGDLVLKFLIPNSFSLTQVQNFASAVSVTGTSGSGLTLFSTNPWTSGDLEANYLGITSFANGSPPNPLSAWIGATKTIDPSASGYYVLQADVGNYSLPTPGGTLPDIFTLSPAVYAAGGLIVADLYTGPNHTLDVTTAQSGALFYNGANGGPFATPVPGPVVGAGLPGLLMAGGGLLGWWRRKRKVVAAA